jgi:hypothetical protein
MNDATEGAHDKENALGVSADMESIIGNSRFQLKETIMSSDSLDERGELEKVLGLRWETEKNKICVDIKLNYGEKIKGTYIEQDDSLTDLEVSLLDRITRSVLWRVAQSKYNPLGLRSIYMVKRKLLMRKITLKGKVEGWESILDPEEEDKFRAS